MIQRDLIPRQFNNRGVDMATFEHKGVTISMEDSSGRFTAAINGRFARFPSLAAAKKKIDAANEFVPFPALDMEYSTIVEFTVTGIEKARGRSSWSNPDVWICDDKKPRRAVYPLAAREVLKKIIAHKAETRCIQDERAEQLRAIESGLPDALRPQ